MPSFFKKLIYGKELSNPYVNPYHPGHVSTGTPIHNSHVNNRISGGQTQIHNEQSRMDSTASGSGSGPLHLRPSSPSHLEEARRMVGRDPVTGRRLPPPSTRTRSSPADAANVHTSTAVAAPTDQTERTFRSDVLLRDQRRRREEEESRAQAQRELEGYFSPIIRPVVREGYGRG
ncbi:hypothetical protein SVAN01_08664 [Stagonosporopsis vannaccii]|nr:hypothetical protein SVAN01_08664 [Stagonosporopsis vannaccii]